MGGKFQKHVNEREVSEADELKIIVFEHFHDQSQAGGIRPHMGIFYFSQIANQILIDRFLEEEIKFAVWECDSH